VGKQAMSRAGGASLLADVDKPQLAALAMCRGGKGSAA